MGEDCSILGCPAPYQDMPCQDCIKIADPALPQYPLGFCEYAISVPSMTSISEIQLILNASFGIDEYGTPLPEAENAFNPEVLRQFKDDLADVLQLPESDLVVSVTVDAVSAPNYLWQPSPCVARFYGDGLPPLGLTFEPGQYYFRDLLQRGLTHVHSTSVGWGCSVQLYQRAWGGWTSTLSGDASIDGLGGQPTHFNRTTIAQLAGLNPNTGFDIGAMVIRQIASPPAPS
eukprot:SAG31_NODE_15216_length_765_cov_0.627628_1_plen_230_part_10